MSEAVETDFDEFYSPDGLLKNDEFLLDALWDLWGKHKDAEAKELLKRKIQSSRQEAIEEAAKVADRHAQPTGNDQWELGAGEIARDIRELVGAEGKG